MAQEVLECMHWSIQQKKVFNIQACQIGVGDSEFLIALRSMILMGFEGGGRVGLFIGVNRVEK